jgi:hypothetical protein
VSGATVINAEVFDLDGFGMSPWMINASLSSTPTYR